MPIFGRDAVQDTQIETLLERVSTVEEASSSFDLRIATAELTARNYTDAEIIQLQEELNMAFQNALNNAFRAGVQFILGSDATGDIYYRSATNGILARLGIGTAGQQLVVNNGLPAWADRTPLNYSVITANQVATINSGYIVNSGSLATVTLPATAAVGSVIEIIGMGAGGWRLGQATGQQVIFGNMSNTSGASGQLNSSHQRDCIRLVNIIADTTWQVVSSLGNIDVI